MLGSRDGHAICKNIKGNRLTYALPVSMISGTHNLNDSLGLAGAPEDFVAKPFDIKLLLERITQQLAAIVPSRFQ